MAFNYEMMGYIALQMEARENKIVSIKDIDRIIHYYEKYKKENTATLVNSNAQIHSLTIDKSNIDWGRLSELTMRTHPNT